ncbi:hypothetical protein GPECTOR_15g314 [Gonium pectorale]|uniref:Protein PHLOEM PROTEIN 2-LIKE A10 n=1 Tax=Gonium pectorale TaxID=33097 RepID=A0A150GMQ6_GONPE|nr:hypothetical protein GPECTOR_15g314 [Gonium pectorale]|eukprot:KXZ50630.1 hypothetical protein GPECTOR_15g314 [Gonium pectorale]
MSTPSTSGRGNPYLLFYHQHKVLVWGAAAAAAVTLYAAYQGSADPRKKRPPSQLQRLRKLLADYSAAAQAFGDTAALVSSDLQQFLQSESSELPQSLRQLNKLLQSPQLQETVATCSASVCRGVASAVGNAQCGCDGDAAAPGGGRPPVLDTILEAALSDRGRGLIGMAVGVAARNAAVAACDFIERRMDAASAPSTCSSSAGTPASPRSPAAFAAAVKDLLASLSGGRGEQLLALLLTKSIRAAVTSYVDATAGRGSSLADGLVSTLTKPETRDALTDLSVFQTST